MTHWFDAYFQGGTYVTRPVVIEDRDYSDSDIDVNDIAIQSKQVDGITGIKSAAQGIKAEAAGATYLTDNITGTAGLGGSTFRTDNLAGDVDGDSDFHGNAAGDPLPTEEIISNHGNRRLIDDMMTGYRLKDVIITSFDNADSFASDPTLIGFGAVHPDTPMDTHPNDNLLGFPGSGVDNLAREDGYCFAEENADGYTEVEWTYFADNLSGTAGPGGSTFPPENVAGFPYDSFGLDSSTVDVMNVTLSPASNSEYA